MAAQEPDGILSITREDARRFLLGRQGLWPGRRWSGKRGTVAALRALEAVQMDPMTVVARSHDLVLWSRVAGYKPVYLDQLLYRDRAFFDYGGHLDIYPLEELPFWRPHMRRRGDEARQAMFAEESKALLDQVRAEVRARGPLGNRDFAGSARVRSYRGRKDTGLALYHLWLTGELMTHSRRGFERLYDLRERIASAALDREATEAEAERFFAAKALRQVGLGTGHQWAGTLAYQLQRRIPAGERRATLAALVADGSASVVAIEGIKEPYYLPAAELPLLLRVRAGRVPREWRASGSTTQHEVNLLSPIDTLLARQRTQVIFDFAHLWEVYKPAARRRWGSYTMPILYGDRLVGRIDPKLDRGAATLQINGFWLEDEAISGDHAFVAALARGLAHFARFHAAVAIDFATEMPPGLRDQIDAELAT